MNEKYPPELLTTAQAASLLSVSESWLRQRRMTGQLDGKRPSPPFVKLGRAVRYCRTDLREWLADNARPQL